MRKLWLATASLLLALSAPAIATDRSPRCIDAPLLGCVAGQTWTGTHTFSGAVNLPSGAIDAVADLTAGIRTGTGAKVATSTGTLTNGRCVEINAAGDFVEAAAACGTGGATAWNAIGDAAAGADIDMVTFPQTMTWSGNLGTTAIGLRILDNTSNASTGALFHVSTVGSSTAKPVRFTAGGTTNGVEMSTAGVLSKLGTGSVLADNLSLASQATGDIAYNNAGSWTRLAGAVGVLHGAVGAAPSYSAVVTGDIADGTITSADISNTAFISWNENLGSAGGVSRTLGAPAREISAARHSVIVTANGLFQEQVATGSEGVNTYSIAAAGDDTLTFSADPGTVVATYELQ